jgi:hypothetical protein
MRAKMAALGHAINEVNTHQVVVLSLAALIQVSARAVPTNRPRRVPLRQRARILRTILQTLTRVLK